MQRVKDVDRFLHELERPLPQEPGTAKTVTQAELEQDGDSFVAFASAFGVKKPTRLGARREEAAVVPSAPAS